MNNGVMVAGEGRSIWVIGDRYTIKCSGNDTSGAYALLEAVVPPGAGPPPHISTVTVFRGVLADSEGESHLA